MFILKEIAGILLVLLGLLIILIGFWGDSLTPIFTIVTPVLVGLIGIDRIVGWFCIDEKLFFELIMFGICGSGLVTLFFEWTKLPSLIQGITFASLGLLLMGVMPISLFLELAELLTEGVYIMMLPILVPILIVIVIFMSP